MVNVTQFAVPALATHMSKNKFPDPLCHLQPDDNRFDRDFTEPPSWENKRSVLGGECYTCKYIIVSVVNVFV